MEIRYSSNQRDFKRYTTEETRKELSLIHILPLHQGSGLPLCGKMCVKLFFEPPSQRFGMQLGPDFYAGRGTARHIGGCHCRMWTIGAAPAAAGAGCGAEFVFERRPCDNGSAG